MRKTDEGVGFVGRVDRRAGFVSVCAATVALLAVAYEIRIQHCHYRTVME